MLSCLLASQVLPCDFLSPESYSISVVVWTWHFFLNVEGSVFVSA